MARNLKDRTNIQAPNANYPNGRVIDDTGAGDGTPLDESILGDYHQFFAKLMRDADVVPNDLPDNETDGNQLFFSYFMPFLKLHGVFNEPKPSEAFFGGLQDIWVVGNKAYLPQASIISVFDVTDGSPIPSESFGSGVLSLALNITIEGAKAYVSDRTLEKVLVFDITTGAHLSSEDFGTGVLNFPKKVVINDGKAYVVDSSNSRVHVFDLITSNHLSAKDLGTGGELPSPNSLFIAFKRIYVSDSIVKEVRVFDLSTSSHLSSEDFGSGTFNIPQGIWIIGKKMYVVDFVNKKVYVFDVGTGNIIPLETFDLTGFSPIGIFITRDRAYVTSDFGAGDVTKQNLIL